MCKRIYSALIKITMKFLLSRESEKIGLISSSIAIVPASGAMFILSFMYIIFVHPRMSETRAITSDTYHKEVFLVKYI